jgi:magnesium chelatase subunit I
VRHPARIVLVGSGNPEEGELRPQLLDRFGLSLEVRTPGEPALWVEIVKRRDAFERDPAAFLAIWAPEEEKIRKRIVKARRGLNAVEVPDAVLERAAALCIHLKTDGLRGQLTLMRAARALAAFEGAKRVGDDHLRRMATPSLRHRLRRNPLDETGSATRISRAVAEVLGA